MFFFKKGRQSFSFFKDNLEKMVFIKSYIKDQSSLLCFVIAIDEAGHLFIGLASWRKGVATNVLAQ